MKVPLNQIESSLKAILNELYQRTQSLLPKELRTFNSEDLMILGSVIKASWRCIWKNKGVIYDIYLSLDEWELELIKDITEELSKGFDDVELFIHIPDDLIIQEYSLDKDRGVLTVLLTTRSTLEAERQLLEKKQRLEAS